MRIGAMWKKKDKNNNVYYSCTMESPFLPGGKLYFNIFANTSEDKNDKSPDGFLDWNNNPVNNNYISDEDIPM